MLFDQVYTPAGTVMNEFKSWESYWHFTSRVQREVRFLRTSEDDDFLREVVRTSKTRVRELPAGYVLWRAQIGHDWHPHYQDKEYIDDFPAPYPPSRMKPLPGRATEGRANPKGIPVLYLSTQPKTAMSEVRPWLGSLVSCARFETMGNLTIIDLSVYHRGGFVLFFSEPDALKKEKAVWTEIDKAFSKPTTSTDEAADYVPTQVIAELFKREGHDGIAYKSAFGDDGYNIVLFDPDNANLTSCGLFKVKSLDLSFEQNCNPYSLEKEGTKKTAHAEVIESVLPIDESE